MAYGNPSNASLEARYKAAKNVDQNCVANEAFKLAYLASGSVPVHPTSVPVWVDTQSMFCLQLTAHMHPTPANPIPMDIDGGRQRNMTSLTCYQCHQPRHKVLDCPLNFNIRLMTIEEVEMELMVKKDMARVREVSPVLEEVMKLEEDFVQDNK